MKINILSTLLLTRFYQGENIESITLFNSITNALDWIDIPLPDRKVGYYERQGRIYKIWAASNIGQNRHFVLKKKETKISPHPIQSLF